MFKMNGLIIFTCLVLICSINFGQNTPSASRSNDMTSNESLEDDSSHYIAEVIAKDVYVRSGPGTAYYHCSKLSTPQRVIVVGNKFGYYEILPPAGSFSWIHKNYVRIDPDNPTIGFVTSESDNDKVRVWAGSEFYEPLRSSSLQIKLNVDDMVKLIDKADAYGDYLKIEPPAGAHLWISSRYVKYVGPVPKPKPLVLPPKPKSDTPVPSKTVESKPETMEPAKPQTSVVPSEPKIPIQIIPEPTEPEPTAADPVLIALSSEHSAIEECKKISKKIEEELAKPINQQNYDDLKVELIKIKDAPNVGRAKLHAEYHLERIGRYELAISINEEINRQDEELEKVRKMIQDTYQSKIDIIPNPGKYAIIGKIKPSNIYTEETGRKRYMIINDKGKIIAYAIPVDNNSETDINELINKKVGLKGKILDDPRNPIGLIMFTEIKDLTDEIIIN